VQGKKMSEQTAKCIMFFAIGTLVGMSLLNWLDFLLK